MGRTLFANLGGRGRPPLLRCPRRHGRPRPFAAALTVLAIMAVCSPAAAAELKLRHECRCAQSLVRLSDVAEIHAADAAEAEKLGQIELFPAPAQGQPRYLRARELQDLLALRGLNLTQHRLSGASRVEVRSAAESKSAKPSLGPLTTSMMIRAEELVKKAVLAYLQQEVSSSEPWRVEIKLENDQARAVFAAAQQNLVVSGGTPPFKGRQKMTLLIPGDEGDQSLEIEPVVGSAPLVAVATRSLAPGDNVQATDVKLAQVSTRQAEEPFYRLEDLIGQQAIGAIVEGQVIDRADVRSPLLVRRGDAVTVYARSAGVQVRTTARAQDEGSRGDLITVESMLNRQRFFARVTGIHEVEVFAHAVEAPSSPAAAPAARPAESNVKRAGYEAGRTQTQSRRPQ